MTEDPVVDREAACSDAAAAEAGAAEAAEAAADGSVEADGSVAEESEESEDDEVDSFTSDLVASVAVAAASEDPDFNDWAICSFSCFKLVTRLLNIFSCLLIVI